MDFNVNQLVRSGVVLLIGLPISLGVAVSNLPEPESKATKIQDETKAELTETCLNYAFSGRDTKAERNAKDAIDERFGDNSNYGEVCKWVLG